jgi:maleylpyruvate isomerase
MIGTLDLETIKLRERLGKGARYDATSAPALELDWARRGTAYFARKLNELTDDELDRPTLISGWSRRRLIGHVGHQARALSRIVEAARTGQPWSEASDEERLAELNAATLPARALRNLFYHSEVHLNVEWRDLTASGWNATVILDGGRSVPVRETPATRARAVWIHAVDLDSTGSFRDFPSDFLDWLAAETVRLRTQGADIGWVLKATDRQVSFAFGHGNSQYVEGSLADLLQWLFGRGARRLSAANPELLREPLSLPAPIREVVDG